MIKNISITNFPLELTKPFIYATLTLNELPYALVTVADEQGMTGYGEVAAAWDVNGETPEGAMVFSGIINRLLTGQEVKTVDDVVRCLSIFSREIAYNYALKAGLEAALLDLLGKKLDTNILQLLGVQPKTIISQRIISMADYPAVTSGQLDNKLESATFVKVKSSNDLEKLIPVLTYIRHNFPQTKITIDANQGWGEFSEAMQLIKKVAPFQIEWIEQPALADDIKTLTKLTQESPIPIMLDESICTYSDAVLHLEAKAGNMINIKLAKCGGILEAVKIASWCDEHGIRYMIGDMLHSQLGTATNLYAGALSNPVVQDVMEPDRLAHDPTSGNSYTQTNNSFMPSTEPGLGIEIISSK